ncbi:hypothetical protein C8R43DRAFT_845579, partial [Mycena crocata]
IGMPVMIKANEATELCITKGQEAEVVGWDSAFGPSGQRILDTLFVRLVNPPRKIQIPDLPLNVVPLGRTSNHITCLLRDDSLLSLTRQQSMVLPNFSMTDYGSQGKSRDPNVVHLNNCKNHHNYYVALSRGYTAEGTCIIQGFDPKKITSGISGFLRQEFRELELLDEITRLRHEGCLPRTVTGIYRGQLLASYQSWKGNFADPEHFHPAIRSKPEDQEATELATDYSAWKPTIEEPTKKGASNKASPKKRKLGEHEDRPPAKKQEMQTRGSATGNSSQEMLTHNTSTSSAIHASNHGVQTASPVGLVWDGRNYSCGYDSFFTPLASLWGDNQELWTQRLTDFSPLLGLWATVMSDNRNVPEAARDAVRRLLHFQSPTDFPLGPNMIKLDALFMGLTRRRSYGSGVTHCDFCGYREPGVTDTFGQYINVWNTNELRRNYPNGHAKLRRRTTIHDVPEVLIVGINFPTLVLNEELQFHRNNNVVTLKLRGLIYHSQMALHFTSVILDAEGIMWYHDGISTGRTCVNNGRFTD